MNGCAGMSSGNLEAFQKDVGLAIGAEHVALVGETIRYYGEHTLPAPDRPPAAVIYPCSTAEVQAVVRAANAHRVPIFPITFVAAKGTAGSSRSMPGATR